MNLKSNTTFFESELEQALIEKLQEFLLELGRGFSLVARQYRISARWTFTYRKVQFTRRQQADLCLQIQIVSAIREKTETGVNP